MCCSVDIVSLYVVNSLWNVLFTALTCFLFETMSVVIGNQNLYFYQIRSASGSYIFPVTTHFFGHYICMCMTSLLDDLQCKDECAAG